MDTLHRNRSTQSGGIVQGTEAKASGGMGTLSRGQIGMAEGFTRKTRQLCRWLELGGQVLEEGGSNGNGGGSPPRRPHKWQTNELDVSIPRLGRSSWTMDRLGVELHLLSVNWGKKRGVPRQVQVRNFRDGWMQSTGGQGPETATTRLLILAPTCLGKSKYNGGGKRSWVLYDVLLSRGCW